MKKNVFWAGMILLAFIMTSGTCNESNKITLKTSEAATRKVDGTNYTIIVTDIKDSRCPKDVKCIRAGEAFVNISFKRENGGEQLLQFCTGIDCRHTNVTDINTIDILTGKIEIKLLSVTPDPTQTKTDGTKKATFTIRKL